MTTTEQLTDAQKAELVQDYAAQTIGSESFHRHWTGTLIYTDGIAHLAETCGAHWLIDAVASYQTIPRVKRETFQVWRLRSPAGDDDWILDAWTDTPDTSGNLIVSQEIGYSDFPVELCPFEWWVEFGTLMLKEER